MKKIAVSIADLKKKKQTTKNLIRKAKHILVLVMFILLCWFSGGVEARGEIPDNIIQEKENSINEIMLGAREGISLTRTYTEGTEVIKLTWNNIEEATKYNIYQSKEGESEKVIATVSSTSVTLNNNNAGIKDEEAPTMPQVTATQTEDGLGNNISITASTDKGTTYRHRIEEKIDMTKVNGDVLFLIDLSGTMKKFRNLFMEEDGPILLISKELIQKYNMRVGTMVMANKSSNMIRGELTQDIDAIRGYIKNFDGRNNHLFSIALNEAINELEKGGTRNKIIILFSDCDSDYDKDYENSADVAAKKANLAKMQEAGIKLYTIYRTTDSRLYMDKYSNAFIVQPEVNKEKQVEAFNKIFNNIIEELPAKSNTVSTTVTSGLKGYQYAVTTSSTHTFTNEEIVGIEEIPSYISGEEQMVQYLHIRAVDNSGNASETRSILLQVPAKITLKSEYTYGENEVPLSWTINDPREGYKYRLYQKEENQEKFTLIATNNSVETITKNEIKQDRYTTPGTYTWTVPQGVTEIKVIVASAGEMGEESLFGEYSSKENEEENGEISEEIKEYTLQVNENEEYQVKIGKRRK